MILSLDFQVYQILILTGRGETVNSLNSLQTLSYES